MAGCACVRAGVAPYIGHCRSRRQSCTVTGSPSLKGTKRLLSMYRGAEMRTRILAASSTSRRTTPRSSVRVVASPVPTTARFTPLPVSPSTTRRVISGWTVSVGAGGARGGSVGAVCLALSSPEQAASATTTAVNKKRKRLGKTDGIAASLVNASEGALELPLR